MSSSQNEYLVTSNLDQMQDHNPCRVRPRSVFKSVTHNLINSQPLTEMDVTDMTFDDCPDTTSLAASDFYDVNYMLISLTETSTGTVTTLDQTVPSSIFSSLTQTFPPVLNIIASETELTAGTYTLTYLASFTEETSSEI